jgi:hypothetical protein
MQRKIAKLVKMFPEECFMIKQNPSRGLALVTIIAASMSMPAFAKNDNICSNLSGEAGGICQSYCVAKSCADDNNMKNENSCLILRDKFTETAGYLPPCLFHPVAVGYSIGIAPQALAYFSNDGGINWNLSSIQGPQGSILNSVTCSGDDCIAAGSVSNGQFFPPSDMPLAYISTDAGVTFTPSSPIRLPNGYGSATLLSVSCSGSNCAAVGNGTVGFFGNLPVAYSSIDKGINWTASSPIIVPNGNFAFLRGVQCDGLNCAAVGNTLASNNDPLAYISTDGGSNWTLATFATGQNTAQLNGLKCVANHCVAVGVSQLPSGISKPVTYTSNDHGSTWQVSAPLPAPPPSQGQGASLAGVDCVNATCTAVGAVQDLAFGTSKPLAYLSNDGGLSWQISAPLSLPVGQLQGQLSSVTCVSTYCSAVGMTGGSFSPPLPLAYTSKDSGANWTLSPALPQPARQPFGALRGVD